MKIILSACILMAFPITMMCDHVNVVIIGATGDLAQKYLWQGFFNVFTELTNQNHSFKFYGSTKGSVDEQRPKLLHILNEKVKCPEQADRTECTELKRKFINQTEYFQLKTESDYANLGDHLNTVNASLHEQETGRIFYLSLPPSAYISIGNFIHKKCRPANNKTWIRLVIEKPFGKDKETAQELTKALTSQFAEHEIYRTDHYLGKSVVKGILPLRNMNKDGLEQLLNKNHVDRVEVAMLEKIGVQGRVDFYEQYGVICDVMQNHMMEMLTLVAMDLPYDIADSSEVKAKKLRLLQQIEPVKGSSLLQAQYNGYIKEGMMEMSRANFTSKVPTFAAAVLKIKSPRWENVPFVLVSGKKMVEKASYIRVVFKENKFNMAEHKLFSGKSSSIRQLVFQVSLASTGEPSVLFSNSLGSLSIPDSLKRSSLTSSKDIPKQSANDIISFVPRKEVGAYTSIINDLVHGRQENFVGSVHLMALWDIWSPVLHSTASITPRTYMPGNQDGMLDFTLIGYSLVYDINPVSIQTSDTGTENILPKLSSIPSHFLGGKLFINNTEMLTLKLADHIEKAAHLAISQKGVFHLALSGGRSPRKLFRHLAHHGTNLPWKWVHIWLVDERCVPFTDVDSNFRGLEEYLLSFVNIPYINIHPMLVEKSGNICDEADMAAENYEKNLRYFIPNIQIDFVLLGLGADGHTASLFPNQPSLRENGKLVVLSKAPGQNIPLRMTLTYKAINSASDIAVLSIGRDRHDIIDTIQNHDNEYQILNFPILGVKPTYGNMTWYIDTAAFYGV